MHRPLLCSTTKSLCDCLKLSPFLHSAFPSCKLNVRCSCDFCYWSSKMNQGVKGDYVSPKWDGGRMQRRPWTRAAVPCLKEEVGTNGEPEHKWKVLIDACIRGHTPKVFMPNASTTRFIKSSPDVTHYEFCHLLSGDFAFTEVVMVP